MDHGRERARPDLLVQDLRVRLWLDAQFLGQDFLARLVLRQRRRAVPRKRQAAHPLPVRGFSPRLQLDLPPRARDRRFILALAFVICRQGRERLQRLPVPALALDHHPLFKGRAVQRKPRQQLAPVQVDSLAQSSGAVGTLFQPLVGVGLGRCQGITHR